MRADVERFEGLFISKENIVLEKMEKNDSIFVQNRSRKRILIEYANCYQASGSADQIHHFQ